MVFLCMCGDCSSLDLAPVSLCSMSRLPPTHQGQKAPESFTILTTPEQMHTIGIILLLYSGLIHRVIPMAGNAHAPWAHRKTTADYCREYAETKLGIKADSSSEVTWVSYSLLSIPSFMVLLGIKKFDSVNYFALCSTALDTDFAGGLFDLWLSSSSLNFAVCLQTALPRSFIWRLRSLRHSLVRRNLFWMQIQTQS